MPNEASKVMNAAQTDALFLAAKGAMPEEVKKADLMAEIRRVHYDASMRKGFTAEEALILCTQTRFD